jgi:hypothetical protein
VRRTLIALLLVAAILVAADVGLRAYAERRVARASASALDLSPAPSVGIGGFPFIVHAVSGSFSGVSLIEDRASIRGIPIESMVLRADEAHVSPTSLLRGTGTIRLSGVTSTFRANGADLGALLRQAGHELPIRISGSRVSVTVLGRVVAVELSLSNGSLVASALGIPAVRVPLPRIVSGLHYTSIRVLGAEVVVSARATHLEISI